MTDTDEGYQVVAVVSAEGIQRKVLCSQMPTPQQINLIHALGEHVSRIISSDDLCHRLKISVNTLRVQACRLRKLLHHDWIIERDSSSTRYGGFRLCYIGGELAEAKRTDVKLDDHVVDALAEREKARAEKIRRTLWRREDLKYIDPKYLVDRDY